MAQALYRKYRPSKLEDVLGHEVNTEILRNAAKNDRLAQAYLFYGSRGTGKTTTARLIAKLLNCEKRRDDPEFRKLGEPCNVCKSCEDINRNMSLDVIEIDAASNRGIDEIRNLKESIQTAPTSGRFKVYIIDEAHMLTGPAFNALLKTLEEPPRHASFILATTEYEKVPATIASRTQRFLFKKLPKTVIMQKLAKITAEEKIKIGEDALELIASAAEGSLRDAESLLDQISASDKTIDLATTERVMGRTAFKKVEEAARLILTSSAPKALAYLTEVNEDGYNLVQFTKDLIHYLRKALMVKVNPELLNVFSADLTAEELKRLGELAKSVSPDKHVPLLKALIRAYSEMRYSPFALIPLEVALVENLRGVV